MKRIIKAVLVFCLCCGMAFSQQLSYTGGISFSSWELSYGEGMENVFYLFGDNSAGLSGNRLDVPAREIHIPTNFLVTAEQQVLYSGGDIPYVTIILVGGAVLLVLAVLIPYLQTRSLQSATSR